MSSLLLENAEGIKKQAKTLFPLVEKLKCCQSYEEKEAVLDGVVSIKNFIEKTPYFKQNLASLTIEGTCIVKSVIAIGQGHRIFQASQWEEVQEKLSELIDSLMPVEKFYFEMGGIVGYHWLMLTFLSTENLKKEFTSARYYRPAGIDLRQKNAQIRQAILWGIEHLGEMAEIYPVGGAADRLRLQDDLTGTALPAAKLCFCGKTLLEGLITDLQAREYLHYKLFRHQICTPVAMMTSHEKDNHSQIISICKDNHWFGRPQSSFRFFSQSAVPTINKAGDWCLQNPFQLLMKPGGHGVIWKLARDEGVFDWLFAQNRKKGLVRQINNPLASCDHGLLAFAGVGCNQDKMFGFASCERQVKASEGINILVEKEALGVYEYTLTNIEYCDFQRFNIPDEPAEEGSCFSKFSSNTNILFIDLKAVRDMVFHHPLPGMLVNLKTSTYKNVNGEMVEEEIARLESTMQNIADCFAERFEAPLEAEESLQLKTYLTYNERRKTISTVKREYTPGSSLLETPEGCFLDMMHNAHELLKEYCGFQLPEPEMNLQPLSMPSFIFHYHPALGPLYSIIAQKLRSGSIDSGSELKLEIAEADISGLTLSGSLLIESEKVMGYSEKGILHYSEQSGKCSLRNVTVKNQGIDPSCPNCFWKNEIYRREACRIFIKGNGEFVAENVCLEGDLNIEVESDTRVTAHMVNGELQLSKEPIHQPSWYWKYTVDSDHQILLTRQSE